MTTPLEQDALSEKMVEGDKPKLTERAPSLSPALPGRTANDQAGLIFTSAALASESLLPEDHVVGRYNQNSSRMRRYAGLGGQQPARHVSFPGKPSGHQSRFF